VHGDPCQLPDYEGCLPISPNPRVKVRVGVRVRFAVGVGGRVRVTSCVMS